MLSATTPLIIAGTLLLSPSHPALVGLKPGAKVWVSKTKVVEVAAASAGQLVIRALDPGLVHISGTQNAPLLRVHVVPDTDYETFARCPRDTERLDLTLSPPRLRRSADLALLAACGRLTRLAFAASPSTDELRDLESRIDAAGARRAGPAQTHDGRIEVALFGCRPKTIDQLRESLGPWGAFTELTCRSNARPGRTLNFDLTFFEFSRQRAQTLGAKFPTSLRFSPFGGGVIPQLAGQLEIGADFGERWGIGRVLSRPRIRTKPGEMATFQSGGELPIKSSGPYSSSTQWKNYGMIVTLTPEGNLPVGAPEVGVALKLELSEPDTAAAIDGVPAMRTRRLESRFDLRVDETTVLTTLLQSRQGQNHEGLPGSRGAGVWSALFGQHSQTAQDSELWVAVRPSWEEEL